jgi:CDGSH iron-sulfur domain-containing protein 3
MLSSNPFVRKLLHFSGGVISLSKVQIRVMDNGSLRVTGEVELIDMDGNVFETKPTFSLCRCGLSSKRPFCDGSHKGKFQARDRAVNTSD